MRGEGRIRTKGKKVGHCHVSQRLLSMIVGFVFRAEIVQDVTCRSELIIEKIDDGA